MISLPLAFDAAAYTFTHGVTLVYARQSLHPSMSDTKVKISSPSIRNFSNVNFTKSIQPVLVGSITVANLKRSNIPLNAHRPLGLSPPVPAPVTRNSTSNKTLLPKPLITENPSNKTIVTLNLTNSSAPSPSHPIRDPVTVTPNASEIPAKIIQQQWTGLSYDFTPDTDVPPDVQIAVGANHIAELVNFKGEIWSKHGPPPKEFTLRQFFNAAADTISDPRIIYDNASQRWFSSILDRSNDSVIIAISISNDPLGRWNVYDFHFTDCPDEPMIATSNDKLVISANDVPQNCLANHSIGAQYEIIDKNDLMTGFREPRFWLSEVNMSELSVLPIKMADPSEGSNITMATIGTQGSDSLTLYTFSGKVPFLPRPKVVTYMINTTVDPELLNAIQPQPDVSFKVGDGRLLDGSILRGKIWLTFTDGCVPKHGDKVERSCIGLIQIDTLKNKIHQFDFSYPFVYLFYPAINVDQLGNMHIVFGISSNYMFPSLYVSGQMADSVGNTLDQAENVTIGGGVGLSSRYGDYFSLVQDPTNPNTFWVAGEISPAGLVFPRANFWSTVIDNITTTGSPSPMPR